MNEVINDLKMGIVPLLQSENLFNAVVKSYVDEDIKALVEKNASQIIFACCFSFTLFDYLTITHMIHSNIAKDTAKVQLKRSLNGRFSNKTNIYLVSKYKKLNLTDFVSEDELFDTIISDLKNFDTLTASALLFDLYNFDDFRGYLSSHHPVLTKIIKYYKKYDKEVVGNGIYKGSSIIAKLLDSKCEQLAYNYIINLINSEHVNYSDVTMIGGGGSNLVFKIGDKVLKLGETRNCRKIFINHRILASLVRKLEIDEETGKELFYAEVMKYIYTGVTEEERDELRNDLAKQGIIWEDDKLENCGYLPDGYDNECPLKGNYDEVLANVENPLYKEQFNRRRKRVVVLDSDNMHLDTTKLQKY